MKIQKKDFIEYAGAAVLVVGGLAATIIGDPVVKKMLFVILSICMWVLTLFQVLEYRYLEEKTTGDLVYTVIFAIVALVITGATAYMFIQF